MKQVNTEIRYKEPPRASRYAIRDHMVEPSASRKTTCMLLGTAMLKWPKVRRTALLEQAAVAEVVARVVLLLKGPSPEGPRGGRRGRRLIEIADWVNNRIWEEGWGVAVSTLDLVPFLLAAGLVKERVTIRGPKGKFRVWWWSVCLPAGRSVCLPGEEEEADAEAQGAEALTVRQETRWIL